jgi:hypothetical protein
MKTYIKGDKIRRANQIVIVKDGMSTGNPTEDMILDDGWVEYALHAIENIDDEKVALKNDIHRYDESSEVNTCVINYQGNEINYWADKHTRTSLYTSINDYIKVGKATYRLDIREFGVSIEIPCEDLLNMLTALEVYAVECYNVTTDHLYAVDKLETIEEVRSYDYRQGYPEKPTFHI